MEFLQLSFARALQDPQRSLVRLRLVRVAFEQDERAAPKTAAAVLQKQTQAAHTRSARSFSGAEGQLFTAARVHSFWRRSLTTLAQSDVGKIVIHRGSCTTQIAGEQSPAPQFKRSKPTARTAARGSFEHRGGQLLLRVSGLFKLKNRTGRTKLMLSHKLRALNSLERRSVNRLKF